MSVVDLDTLLACRNLWNHPPRQRVVWTNGCFDLFHLGHLRSIQAARKLGDRLVVGVNSDRSVRQIKGHNRPFIPEKERAEIVAGIQDVDSVVIFDGYTGPVIEKLKPDICVKGEDYEGIPTREREVMWRLGGAMCYTPNVPKVSTSSIADRIYRTLKEEYT